MIVQPAKCYIDFEMIPNLFSFYPEMIPFFLHPCPCPPLLPYLSSRFMMTAAINVPLGNAFVKKKKKKITLRAKVGIISGAVKFTSSLSEIRRFVAEFISLIIS